MLSPHSLSNVVYDNTRIVRFGFQTRTTNLNRGCGKYFFCLEEMAGRYKTDGIVSTDTTRKLQLDVQFQR